MVDKTIPDLTALAGAVADDDEIEVADTSAAGATRKATRAQMLQGQTHAAADVTSGTFADARISESSVTQHQAALSIGLSQVTGKGDSAALNVGTAPGTVAAGDHDHAGVYQPADADLTALAAADNSAILAATTASFLTADETKLDGIEAGAEVNDVASVHGRTGAVVGAVGDYDGVAATEDEVTGAKTLDNADFNQLQRYTGAGHTWTFDDAGAAGFIPILNKGSGAITPASGTATIEGATTIPVNKAACAIYYGAGTNVRLVVEA